MSFRTEDPSFKSPTINMKKTKVPSWIHICNTKHMDVFILIYIDID